MTDQVMMLDVLEVKTRMILKEDIDLDARVINLRGPITSKSLDRLNKSLGLLEYTGDSEITIMVNSPGGDLYAAFAIIDRLQNSPCVIVTVGTGLVASAAVPILASGDIRKVTQNVSLMFHEPSFNSPMERLTSAEIEAKHVKQLNQRMCKFMGANTHMPYSYWISQGKHVDFYFDAEKAVEIGVVDEILTNSRPQ